jgi:hypothetical protein
MTDDLRRARRRIAATVGTAVWLLYVATTGGAMATGDAVAMLEVAKSIVDRGALDVPSSQSQENWRGPDGRYYTPFGIAQSLYDIPFLVGGRALGRVVGGPLGDGDTLPKALVAAASTLPMAAAVAFGFLLACRLSNATRASVAAALILGAGTLVWPYAKFGFNAALATGFLTMGVYAIAAGTLDRRWPLLAGGATAMGLAVLTRHELALAALVSVAWVTWIVRADTHRGRFVVAAALPVCIALAAWMRLNAMRFGVPWMTGHAPRFGTDGFLAYLASPSGALLLYSPPAIAIAALRRTWREPLPLLLAAVAASLVAFYASLEDWRGTRSYGPRYLVPILPLLVAPLAIWLAELRSRGKRYAVWCLCAAGIAVQIPAVAVDFSKAAIALGQPPPSVHEDTWRWAPMVVNVRALAPAAAASAAAISTTQPVVADRRATAPLAARMPLGLDFWWLYLFQLGVLPAGAAIGAGVLLIAGAILAARDAITRAGALDATARRAR